MPLQGGVAFFELLWVLLTMETDHLFQLTGVKSHVNPWICTLRIAGYLRRNNSALWLSSERRTERVYCQCWMESDHSSLVLPLLEPSTKVQVSISPTFIWFQNPRKAKPGNLFHPSTAQLRYWLAVFHSRGHRSQSHQIMWSHPQLSEFTAWDLVKRPRILFWLVGLLPALSSYAFTQRKEE